jgi:hypothetical protein
MVYTEPEPLTYAATPYSFRDPGKVDYCPALPERVFDDTIFVLTPLKGVSRRPVEHVRM